MGRKVWRYEERLPRSGDEWLYRDAAREYVCPVCVGKCVAGAGIRCGKCRRRVHSDTAGNHKVCLVDGLEGCTNCGEEETEGP